MAGEKHGHIGLNLWDREAGFFKWYTPTTLIKRCVGVAGDTIEYREKKLYVNGELQSEPYVAHTDYRSFPGIEAAGVQLDFQQAWLERRFYRTDISAYVRDNFGPVVVPEGHIMMMGDNRDNSEDARFFGPLPLRYVKGRPLVMYFSTAAAGNPPNVPKILLSPWAIRLGRIGHIVR
ncbi:MAG: signal peptidase I [Syntrophobacteraceae bacterium]|nr:signal peptidase I [Syntrophobacteraceae bacterium]